MCSPAVGDYSSSLRWRHHLFVGSEGSGLLFFWVPLNSGGYGNSARVAKFGIRAMHEDAFLLYLLNVELDIRPGFLS